MASGRKGIRPAGTCGTSHTAGALASLLVLCAGLCPAAWGLTAAASKVDITPDLTRERVFLAGFGATGRKPSGVYDPLYARLLVLKDGPRTAALVSLDLLGLSRNDVEDLRILAGFTGPDRYLFLTATHNHSGPDTLGLWGPLPGWSGVDRSYMRRIKAAIASALRDLERRGQEVSLSSWSGSLDPRGLCKDLRDPAVIDPGLAALSLRDRRGRSVATVVNWACHPETLDRRNRRISADFPGRLCDEVEHSSGGGCLFLNGAIGGLLTPEVVSGEELTSEARRIGEAVADAALKGLARRRLSTPRPALSWGSRLVRLPVENSRYLLFLPALASGHKLFDAGGRPLPERSAYTFALAHLLGLLPREERPFIETEVARLDVGPARILGLPGEVFPELLIGGYDGRWRGGQPLVKPGNPAPPDLARAPRGPYLRELWGRRVSLFAGLANDEIGYLVPGYDFKVSSNLTLSPRPPGDHYEETNSLGPSAADILLDAARALLREPGPAPRR